MHAENAQVPMRHPMPIAGEIRDMCYELFDEHEDELVNMLASHMTVEDIAAQLCLGTGLGVCSGGDLPQDVWHSPLLGDSAGHDPRTS